MSDLKASLLTDVTYVRPWTCWAATHHTGQLKDEWKIKMKYVSRPCFSSILDSTSFVLSLCEKPKPFSGVGTWAKDGSWRGWSRPWGRVCDQQWMLYAVPAPASNFCLVCLQSDGVSYRLYIASQRCIFPYLSMFNPCLSEFIIDVSIFVFCAVAGFRLLQGVGQILRASIWASQSEGPGWVWSIFAHGLALERCAHT